MIKKLLNFSVLAILTTASFTVLAQENNGSAPIFVQKYKQPTVTSRVPMVVTAQQNITTNTTKSDQSRSYQIVDSPNPWAGTSFGRIKEEIDYYDKETGKYYNQYNYMALLAKRGDQAKLGQVSNYLQLNGVFNPQQYQSTMSNAANGGAILSNTEITVAKRRMASANTNTAAGQAVAPTQAQLKKPKTIVKQTDNFMPKRIHQGYDEDMKDDTTEKSKPTNQPIFLR